MFRFRLRADLVDPGAMAVEARESGGASAGDEFLSRVELEVRKEQEIGGEFEHIACRDGDDNDGSGTDGSFVIVVSSGDSVSSEKEIDLDVGGGAEDLLPVPDSGSSMVVVDDEDDGEGLGKEEKEKGDLFSQVNEEKADELGGGDDGEGFEKIQAEEEKVQAVGDMPVVPEEAIRESTRTDHEKKEEGELVGEVLEDEEKQKQKEAVSIEVSKHEGQNQGEEEVVVIKGSNAERDKVIEDLSNAEEKVASKVSKNEEHNEVEEVSAVVDSKEEKEAITEDLNNEEGAAIGAEEQVSKNAH